MSKAKLIELIKMDGNSRMSVLYEMPPDELCELFLMALKEQDRDTRHGCTANIYREVKDDHPLINLAQCACLNYRDKDLEVL